MSAVLAEVVKLSSNRKDWRKLPHPTIERVIAITALIVNKPRSALDLVEALGMEPGNGYTSVLTILDLLHEKELIFVRDWKKACANGSGKRLPVYQWRPGTIGRDVPKPKPKRKPRVRRATVEAA